MRYSLLILALAAGTTVVAQDAAALVEALKGAQASQRDKIIRTADTMPAEAWNLEPGEGSRSFANVIAHIVDAQNNTCGGLVGSTGADRMENSGAGKDALMAALRSSFELCDQAVAQTTADNMFDPIQGFRGPTPRYATLYGNIVHSEDMYGQAAVYLRVEGVGPEARPMGKGKGKGK